MNANQQRFGRIGRPSTFYILREVTLCNSLFLESPSVLGLVLGDNMLVDVTVC